MTVDPIGVRLLNGDETCREHQCRDKSVAAGCLCALAAHRIEQLRTERVLDQARIASLEALVRNPNVVSLDAARERRG
jgi:hypothetical protein